MAYSMLYKRAQYLNRNIEFLIDSNIVEYDMKSAGLSIVKELKLLPESRIRKLEALPKDECKKQIGLIQRDDKDFKEKFKPGFELFRRKLFEENNFQDSDILTIKRDAIYTIDKFVDHTEFGNIVFRKKNTYTSYL